MQRVHFIAIGGAAMHNLAIALKEKGYQVTGSDDEIFEPSRSRLEKQNILPQEFGWFPHKINASIDTIILGMHARPDNPELLKAKELGLNIVSYPEFLYQQTSNKKRIVVAGSHGKTTTTAMILHVLKHLNFKFDYMVGSHIDGFENMVGLSHDAQIAI
ncbi:MAG: Mur ligase domain-containing protein, partial [Salinivirgaceae bacterium]|nr:Mur ligase domain-containing protein [Salinivirgaceae bacterium]